MQPSAQYAVRSTQYIVLASEWGDETRHTEGGGPFNTAVSATLSVLCRAGLAA